MIIVIVPAILPKNFDDLCDRVAQIKGLVSRVQIDIANGSYAPSRTWPYTTNEHFEALVSEKEGLPYWEDMEYEIDMLVSSPEDHAEDWINTGASALIFHIETIHNNKTYSDILQNVRIRGVEVGLALKPSTSNDQLFRLIEIGGMPDFIQCMGNDHIGYHGVSLDDRVYEKIKVIRKRFSDIPIAVDIGVNIQTAPLLIQAGATRLVSGSGVFSGDTVRQNLELLKNATFLL